MSTTIESLTEEKEALDARHEILVDELRGERFERLPDEERNRMATQRDLMGRYSLILQERIKYMQEHPDGPPTEEDLKAPPTPTV